MAQKYQYFRGDGADVDMGEVRDGEEVPFKNRDKCQEARDRHAELGALCSPPQEVPSDYVLQKHDEGHY